MMSTPETMLWRKSPYSGGGQDCVEIASLPGAGIAVRQSKDPDGPVLEFTAPEWAAFVNGVRDGVLQ